MSKQLNVTWLCMRVLNKVDIIFFMYNKYWTFCLFNPLLRSFLYLNESNMIYFSQNNWQKCFILFSFENNIKTLIRYPIIFWIQTTKDDRNNNKIIFSWISPCNTSRFFRLTKFYNFLFVYRCKNIFNE